MKNWVFQINADSACLTRLCPKSQLLTEYVFRSPLRFEDLEEMISHATHAFGFHAGDNGLPRGILCMSTNGSQQALAPLTKETFPIMCTLFGGEPIAFNSDNQIPVLFDIKPQADVIVVPISLVMETDSTAPSVALNEETPSSIVESSSTAPTSTSQHYPFDYTHSTSPMLSATTPPPSSLSPPTANNSSNNVLSFKRGGSSFECQSPHCSRPEDYGVFPCGHALCGACKQTLCSSRVPICLACRCPVFYVRRIENNNELGLPESINSMESMEASESRMLPSVPNRYAAPLSNVWSSSRPPPPDTPACQDNHTKPFIPMEKWNTERGYSTDVTRDSQWTPQAHKVAGEQRCFEARGPRPLLQVLTVMEASDVLTSDMLAALLLQFTPTIFQRIQKKVGRINKGSSNFIASWFNPSSPPQTLVALRQCINLMEQEANLARYAAQLRSALCGKPGAPKMGTLLVDCLRTFSDFSFPVQTHIVASLAPDLLPIWRSVLRWCSTTSAGEPNDTVEHWKVTLQDITHWGYNCAACGLQNIYGPRFRCESCHTRVYDLCGPCYLSKHKIHDATHIFRCLFRDVRHGPQPPTYGATNQQSVRQEAAALAAAVRSMPYSMSGSLDSHNKDQQPFLYSSMSPSQDGRMDESSYKTSRSSFLHDMFQDQGSGDMDSTPHNSHTQADESKDSNSSSRTPPSPSLLAPKFADLSPASPTAPPNHHQYHDIKFSEVKSEKPHHLSDQVTYQSSSVDDRFHQSSQRLPGYDDLSKALADFLNIGSLKDLLTAPLSMDEVLRIQDLLQSNPSLLLKGAESTTSSESSYKPSSNYSPLSASCDKGFRKPNSGMTKTSLQHPGGVHYEFGSHASLKNNDGISMYEGYRGELMPDTSSG